MTPEQCGSQGLAPYPARSGTSLFRNAAREQVTTRSRPVMPLIRKRRRQEGGGTEVSGPSTQLGIGSSLEDDVPLTAAAPTPPASRKKLRRAHEAAADGGAKTGRRDGRARRASAVAPPTAGARWVSCVDS